MHAGVTCFLREWENSHSAFQTPPERVRTSGHGASQVCVHMPWGHPYSEQSHVHVHTVTHVHEHPFLPSPPQAISIAHRAYLIMPHITAVWKARRSTESSEFPHRSHLFFVAVQHYTDADIICKKKKKKWWRHVKEEEEEEWREKRRLSPKASCLLLTRSTMNGKLILQHFGW